MRGRMGGMRFRKPRFTLLMLLIVVTICAFLCATIWQFWPRFRAYQARMRFETAASRFHAGMSVDDINNITKIDAGGSYTANAKGRSVGAVYYFFDGAWYFVYLELDTTTGIQTSSEQPCTSVKTFRLAVPPVDYKPQTQTAKDEINPTEFIRTTHMTPNGPISVRMPPKTGLLRIHCR
jgi:hypothetical protein